MKKNQRKILEEAVMIFSKSLFLLFFSLVISEKIYCEDFSQTVSEESQIEAFEADLKYNSEEERKYPSIKKRINGFISGTVDQDSFEEKMSENNQYIDQENNNIDASGSHIPSFDNNKNFKISEGNNDVFGETLDGQFEKTPNYIEYKNKDIVREKHNKAKDSYSFLYIKDFYSYTDENNAYEKTFEQSDKGHKLGTLHLDYRKYFSKGLMNTHISFGIGIGHARANGLFIDDSSISRTTFQIWTFPIDLWLGAELHLGETFKVSLAAGPSALPIIQSRNDREQRDVDKEYQQFGTGFSGLAKLQINWSRLSSDTGFVMLSNYGVSNFYVDLLARYQSYDNFKDNIQIEGISYGIGFSFEYL